MAAAEGGGGSNLGELGIGMMGLTAMQQQQQQQSAQQPQAPPQPQEPAAPAEMPSVMTPAQAAEFVQVSESDIVGAIEAGDLKARKIGNVYRISKANLEAFLAG